jgi:hypothetical protein
VTAAEVSAPPGHLHQGAIYGGVPLLWYTDLALALRPKDGRDYGQLQVERATEDATAFVGSHLAVAWARRRPVLVLSPRQELRRQVVRVLALHDYADDEQLAGARPQIERGEVPGLVHVGECRTLDWPAHALALGQVLEVPRTVLEGRYVTGVHQVCTLRDAALALVLSRLRAYLTQSDRPRTRR